MAYVTVEDVADFLSIPDDIDHVRLERATSTAIREVDRFCGWGSDGFAQGDASATARTVEATDCHVLRFRDGGFWSAVGGVTVKTDDNDDGVFETTWAVGDFELVDIAPSTPGYPTVQLRASGDRRFPLSSRKSQRVEVTAVWGWAAVPAEVEEAAVLRAAQIHLRTRTADGVSPLTGFRAGGRDRDWDLLLHDYRHPSRLFPGWR